jgi:glycosyltransferase involved in cell wall biosynthesis
MCLKSSKNVCIIHPNKRAYSESFIHNHIRYLPSKVHVLYQLELLTYQENDDKPLVPRPLRVASRWFETLYNYFHDTTRCTTVKELDWMSTFVLRRFLKSKKIDAVLAEYGPTGVAVLDACKEAHVPLIVHFHGFDAHYKPAVEVYASHYLKMFSYAGAVIAVSRNMEKQLLDLGVSREKIHYNVYGVDTNLFRDGRPDKNPPTFIAVGRFVDKKAPQLTLLAFRKVLDRCSSARLIMIADGPLLESCRQIVHALKMTNAVEFLGPKKHNEVAKIMNGARAFVQHSVTTSHGDAEGTPVGVLEAGSSGLPVVSTRHAGIRDVVLEGKTGFLVDEFDVAGMAEQMIALVEQPERALELGRNARKHIEENFSLEESINNLWRIILNCIKEG